jgi:hypothetical protein
MQFAGARSLASYGLVAFRDARGYDGGMTFDFPVNPGPSWSIPRVSAPSCMGLLDQFQTEWWYYVGVVEAANERFSIQIEVLRANFGLPFPFEGVVGYTGIGTQSDNRFFSALGFAVGVSTDPVLPAALTIPPVTDQAYDIAYSSLLNAVQIRATYTGGSDGVRVGTPGAQYTLHANAVDGEFNTFAADFVLTNQRGLVLEGQAGFVGPGMPGGGPVGGGAATYEFAEPLLAVTGTIALRGQSYDIIGGNLWLDRQCLTPPQPDGYTPPASPPDDAAAIKSLLSESGATPVLYTGDWMAIKLDGGPTVQVATFWQPAAAGKKQWITGSAVGIPPRCSFGTVYFPPNDASLNGGIGLIGASEKAWKVGHHGVDFDINLIDPKDPERSPHWQSSSSSGNTYTTAWAVTFAPHLRTVGVPDGLYVRVLVDGCEVDMGSAFFEGAADVFADVQFTKRIGTAFVEQMGFN